MSGEHEAYVDTSGMVTLETYMLAIESASATPSRGGQALAWVMSSLGVCARLISEKLRRARLEDILGEVGNENVQGEQQQKLDVIANNIMMQIMRGRAGVTVLGSEEDEALVYGDAAGPGGKRFALFFDPLDGSGNIDIAGGVGTIFSLYECNDAALGGYALRPGREQIAAGYFLYGSSTLLVLATGGDVSMFVLDPGIGTFVRVADAMRIPDKGNVYSVNEANFETFPIGFQRYVSQCHSNGSSARYAGAMVADVHRVLLKGGVFLYPPTEKAPSGKLRLMYECNPMAKIVTDAGGLAVTGQGDILDVAPAQLHQRVPVIIGSPQNVAEVTSKL